MLITISRQYAAGGSHVARLVADHLGWRLIDNELIDEVAKRAGLPAEEVARQQERAPSFIERLASVTAVQLPELFMAPTINEVAEEARLAQITGSVVDELANDGRLVLVGRASAAVCAGRQDAVLVRLVGDTEVRVRHAIELGVPAEQAEDTVRETDANRARYHRQYYGRDWEDPALYDMVLNTTRLGFEGAAEVVAALAVRRWGLTPPAFSSQAPEGSGDGADEGHGSMPQ